MWFIVEEQKNYMDQIDYGSNFEHICHISKNNQSLKFIVMNDFYKTIIITVYKCFSASFLTNIIYEIFDIFKTQT